MEVCSRRIIGWSMQPTLACQLVLAALDMALQQRQPGALVTHHSDRGSQYASGDNQAYVAAAGIRCSMSRKGDCYDNAPVERFFTQRVPALKTELVYQHEYSTRAAARSAIFEYLEVFYNRQRRHSALGYLSPAVYEAHYQAEQHLTQVA